MANSVDSDQIAPEWSDCSFRSSLIEWAVWSGSALFAYAILSEILV